MSAIVAVAAGIGIGLAILAADTLLVLLVVDGPDALRAVVRRFRA